MTSISRSWAVKTGCPAGSRRVEGRVRWSRSPPRRGRPGASVDCRRVQAGGLDPAGTGPLSRDPPAVRAAVRQQPRWRVQAKEPNRAPRPVASDHRMLKAIGAETRAATTAQKRDGSTPALGIDGGPPVVVGQRHAGDHLRTRPTGVRDGCRLLLASMIVQSDGMPLAVPGPVPGREAEVPAGPHPAGCPGAGQGPPARSPGPRPEGAAAGSGDVRTGLIRGRRLPGPRTAGQPPLFQGGFEFLAGLSRMLRRSSRGRAGPGRGIRRRCGRPAGSRG